MSDESGNTEAADRIWQDLNTVRQLLRRPVEMDIAKSGLTGPQQTLLRFVLHDPGLSIKELGRRMGLAHSTVSGIVDRLERKGLLRREVARQDRRHAIIVAADEVRRYFEETLPLRQRSPLVAVLRSASVEEREIIVSGIATLRRLLEEQTDAGDTA